MSAHGHSHSHGGVVPMLLDSAMSIDGDMTVMDNAMALDDDVDLFGDSVMDNPLDLPARPLPSKQLHQRLDELRTRGCCQGLAWSRQGTIASIARDGRSIDMRFLHCRPDTGAWELSEPYSSHSCLNALSPPAGLITHLAWSATTIPELAVIDTVGRINILTFSITLNRCSSVRKWDSDHVDDLQAVVGCYWLPLALPPNRYNTIYGPAVWRPDRNEYLYESSVCPASGPCHPNPGKSALVCVTTNGTLKLIYSQYNNNLEETSHELESVTSSDNLITHASVCSDKNTLLIALATASRQLRIVRAQLLWNLPQQADKNAPPGAMPLSPTIREQHVTATTWLQQDLDESSLDASMAQLSHVEMLPTLMEVKIPADRPSQQGKEQPITYPPLLITVRSYIPPDPSYNQECQSIIDRWELVTDQQPIHEAFEQLGPKNGPGHDAPSMTRLRKLEPITVPKVVISVSTMQLSKVVCFVFSDGTVQYRDRLTMRELYNEPDANTIMSLHQVGFQFASEDPCLQAAFSPTGCSIAQLCEDSEVKWNNLYYTMQDLDTTMQDNQHSAILSAMTVAIAASASAQNNCDDMLAIARPFAQNPDFVYNWIRQMVQILRISVDYSEEAHHDQLVRNHNLQLCLSILNHLGFRGEFQPRSFGGKFAMLTLNVRNIVILITIANNMPLKIKEKLSPLDEPEVVDALAGCAKWAIDLLSWLSDCLFQLADDPNFMAILADPARFPELAPYLQSRNDVSLHLLLCSSTRGFLSAACRRLSHLEVVSNRAAHYNQTFQEAQKQQQQQSQSKDGGSEPPRPPSGGPPLALLAAYQKIQRFIGSSPVKVSHFEALVNQLSNEIRTAYHASLPGIVAASSSPDGGGAGQLFNSHTPEQQQQARVKRRQAAFELDMLLAGNPPASFREVIHGFFASLAQFKSQTDPARLYFGNYELLEVEDDKASLRRKRELGKYVDVFKRVEVFGGNGKGVGTVAAAPRSGGETRGSGKNTGAGAGMGTVTLPSRGGGPGAVIGGNDVVASSSSSPANNTPVTQWRRCVRCASVMEDVRGFKPGFTFVLGQQRKCACGGNWALVLRSSARS